MTVIVCSVSQGAMAADTMITNDGEKWGNIQKVRRAKDGSLIGMCGTVALMEQFFAWARGGRRKAPDKDLFKEGTCALILRPDRHLLVYEGPVPYECSDDFLVIGSGSAAAKGAWLAGATLEGCVKAAIAVSTLCGGDVTLLKLKGE